MHPVTISVLPPILLPYGYALLSGRILRMQSEEEGMEEWEKKDIKGILAKTIL